MFEFLRGALDLALSGAAIDREQNLRYEKQYNEIERRVVDYERSLKTETDPIKIEWLENEIKYEKGRLETIELKINRRYLEWMREEEKKAKEKAKVFN